MMKRMKNKRGVTLIELIIAVSILAVVAMLMYTFLGQGFRLYAAESDSAYDQQDMRQVFSEITNKARVSSNDTITISGSTLNIDDYAYTLSNGNVYRNTAVLAEGITAFTFSIENEILNLSLTNERGDTITTSLSLKD